MATAKTTKTANTQLPRLATGVSTCPECDVKLTIDQTKSRGAVVVVYYVCPICEQRYRGDRAAARETDDVLYCPECKGKCKPHGNRNLGGAVQKLAKCRHCGLNFRSERK